MQIKENEKSISENRQTTEILYLTDKQKELWKDTSLKDKILM